MGKFYLEDFIAEDPGKTENNTAYEKAENLDDLCDKIKKLYEKEISENDDGREEWSVLERKAFFGDSAAVEFFEDKIRSYMQNLTYGDIPFSDYHESLENAVFNMVWGLGELSCLLSAEYMHARTAIVIGRKLYFGENGEVYDADTIIECDTEARIINAVLGIKSQNNAEKRHAEAVIKNGLSIFVEKGINENRNILVFRLPGPDYCTLEQLAGKNGIPKECLELLKLMAKAGMSVVLSGGRRTGKTEFLSAWLNLESRGYAGLLVESAPEIWLKGFVQDMPLMFRTAEGFDDSDSLGLLSSEVYYYAIDINDNDKADGIAEAAFLSGKRRLKMTYICDDVRKLCECSSIYCFNYVFSFELIKGTGRKMLVGIHEIDINALDGSCSLNEICSYDRLTATWNYKYSLCQRNEDALRYGGDSLLNQFKSHLRRLSEADKSY